MNFNFKLQPFSVYGASLSINYCDPIRWPELASDGKPHVVLRNSAYRNSRSKFNCILDFQFSEKCSFEYDVGRLCVLRPEGTVEFTFSGRHTVLCRGTGIMQMRVMNDTLPYPGGGIFLNASASNINLMFWPVKGNLTYHMYSNAAPKSYTRYIETNENDWAFAIEDFRCVFTGLDTYEFDKAQAEQVCLFESFYRRFPLVAQEYLDTDRQAAYILWSSTVEKGQQLQRDTMYMSKNWMNAVWSWDNCFNAMALAMGGAHPSLAFDQMALPFDKQDESGVLPDTITINEIRFGYTKPPIHGWALSHVLANCEIPDQNLRWLYDKLIHWTEYWLKYADWDQDGICQYRRGNDCGWDNCSGFIPCTPMEGADLSAYLILQMDMIAKLAEHFGYCAEREKWRKASEDLLIKMIEHFWNGRCFPLMASGSHAVRENSDSLHTCLPIILGKKLPQVIRESLVNELRRFLTPVGFASEHPSSPFYTANGYWLGPVWPAAMLILIQGLLDIGEIELAQEATRRFVANVAKNGFAENFDALTGESLRDPAYTWTASVYMLLVRLKQNS